MKACYVEINNEPSPYEDNFNVTLSNLGSMRYYPVAISDINRFDAWPYQVGIWQQDDSSPLYDQDLDTTQVTAIYKYMKYRSVTSSRLVHLRLAETHNQRMNIKYDHHVSADFLNRLQNLMFNVEQQKLRDRTVMEHCFFYDVEKTLNFICAVVSQVQTIDYKTQRDFTMMYRDSICADVREGTTLAHVLSLSVEKQWKNYSWVKRLTPAVQFYVENERILQDENEKKYLHWELFHIAKLIRNLREHGRDVSPELYSDMAGELQLYAIPADRDKALLSYFTTIFPGFVTSLFVWNSTLTSVQGNVLSYERTNLLMHDYIYTKNEREPFFDMDEFSERRLARDFPGGLPLWCPEERELLGDDFLPMEFGGVPDPIQEEGIDDIQEDEIPIPFRAPDQ